MTTKKRRTAMTHAELARLVVTMGDELRRVIDVIAKNTGRITRLEDSLALQYQQKKDIDLELDLLRKLITERLTKVEV